MSVWSDGYISDIEYTTGFYKEVTPVFLHFALSIKGIRPAFHPTGAFAYCELGCGQGYSTQVVAAAHPQAQVYGVDFNPAHIANAREAAEAAGLDNAVFLEAGFEDICKPPYGETPMFDVIALHGVYSWISEDNKRAIIDFIDARLKPGGVLFLSYNCLPGWAGAAPLQKLMLEHAARHPSRSDAQAKAAFDFAKSLMEANFTAFKESPRLKNLIEKFPTRNISYVAHEYLNQHWRALYFTEVAEDMARAKLNFAASAVLADNVAELAVRDEHKALFKTAPDPIFQELLRDYATGNQFRRDIFVRGARSVSASERPSLLGGLCLAPGATPTKADEALKFRTSAGEVGAKGDLYDKVLARVRETPGVSIAALSQALGVAQATLAQSVLLLAHGGQLTPALAEGAAGADRVRALNRYQAMRARQGAPTNYLAGARTGAASPSNVLELIIYEALLDQPRAAADRLVGLAAERLRAAGGRLAKDGKAISDPKDFDAEVKAKTKMIMEEKQPYWRAIGAL